MMADSVYVVIGVGRYPEDGFNVIGVFEEEGAAEVQRDGIEAGTIDVGWPDHKIRIYEVPFSESQLES